MKKVSFLVAFLAFLQLASGARTFAQDRLSNDARRTVEEALDLAGGDIGEELEHLAEQLGLSADRLGAHLERWAEENSEELEAWSEKYSEEWEAWGERFGKKIERIAEDQEGVWGKWAQGYERDLERFVDRLESSEDFEPEQLGNFVEQNLRSLSKMPLGQLVDQALEDGVGELSKAPWESLEELGVLAQDALEEPLGELTEVLGENSNERQAIERGARNLSRAVEQFTDDLERNVSDDRVADQDRNSRRQDSLEDARISALKNQRDRGDLSDAQIERIDAAIKTIEDVGSLRRDKNQRRRVSDEMQERRIDLPKRDQIKARIEREKRRHEETLRQFNNDLNRSSEESRRSEQRESDRAFRARDSRSPKGVDGNNLRGDQPSARSRQSSGQPFQRDGRDGKANRKPVKKAVGGAASNKKSASGESDLDLLREEISRLRKRSSAIERGIGQVSLPKSRGIISHG